MSGRIECCLWSSGTAGDMDATATLAITDAGGTDTFTLTEPLLLTDALSDWQTQIDSSATLVDSYTIAWSSNAVMVTNDNANTFTLALSGNLATALGFSSTPQTGADSYSSDQTPLVRFDDIRVQVTPPTSGGDVALREYAHGRARSIAFGAVDVFACRLWVPHAVAGALFGGYCASGKVRLWCDSSNGSAYSSSNLGGYLDGYVLALTDQRDTSGKVWAVADLSLGYPRSA
jgi:hypothetical protein